MRKARNGVESAKAASAPARLVGVGVDAVVVGAVAVAALVRAAVPRWLTAMSKAVTAATERLARESPGGASKAIATKVRDAAIAVIPTGVTAMVSAEMASAEMETAGTAIAHRLRPELKATSAAIRTVYRMTLVIALIHP